LRSIVFSFLIILGISFSKEWKFFKETPFESIVDSLLNYRVIYIGEVHTDEEIHRIQAKIIEELYKRDKRLVIAMEMFQQPFQEFLELYVEEEISEEDMLEGTEYNRRWVLDPELYAEIWRFAREKGIKVHAINVPTELLREIRKKGLENIKSVYLPEKIVYPPKEYLEFLREKLKAHGENFDEKRFIDIQTAWDNGMAYRIMKLLLLYPEHRVVVIVGKGHVWKGYGIPYVLQKLMPGIKQAVLFPYPSERFYLLFSNDFSSESSSTNSIKPPN